MSADPCRILDAALDDEYRARAIYRAVIARFGPVRPFVTVVEAEDRLVRRLQDLYGGLGEHPPADRWAGRVDPPETLDDAWVLAVRTEIDCLCDIERLLLEAGDGDLRRMLTEVRGLSRSVALPAFKRGAEQVH